MPSKNLILCHPLHLLLSIFPSIRVFSNESVLRIRWLKYWTLESPLDCKEIQPVHSEGDQPWDFFGRNGANAETPVLWPPHAKSWHIGKDSDAGRDWGQEQKGTTEDEIAGWHRWLDGRESQWTPGVGDGQGGLACCDSWGCKESDTTERLIWSLISESIGASASVLPMNIQSWFPLGWTSLISLQSKGLSRVFSNTTVQKHQYLQCSAFFMV